MRDKVNPIERISRIDLILRMEEFIKYHDGLKVDELDKELINKDKKEIQLLKNSLIL